MVQIVEDLQQYQLQLRKEMDEKENIIESFSWDETTENDRVIQESKALGKLIKAYRTTEKEIVKANKQFNLN